MTAFAVNNGAPRSMRATRDDEGHREFRVVHLVQTTTILDGPATVMDAAGLPAIGSVWAFGNDLDLFAWCRPNRTVAIHEEREGDATVLWRVESVFSTKPLTRCQDESIEDPLLEPDRVSGSFVNYTEEAAQDRFGRAIKSSSHEMLRGPQNEWDVARPTVSIGQNRAELGLETLSEMMNTLNDDELWGLPRRCIKLSGASWSRALFGVCDFYYIRQLEFDINFNTFDRDLVDEGTKVLNGHWGVPSSGTGHGTGTWADIDSQWVLDNFKGTPPDPTNPQHFIRYTDLNGNIARVLLNGFGVPLADGDNVVVRHVEKYEESDFLLLEIPTSF